MMTIATLANSKTKVVRVKRKNRDRKLKCYNKKFIVYVEQEQEK